MPKQIVAIIGDYYHDENLSSQALEQIVAVLKEEMDVHLSFGSYQSIIEDLSKNPDVVILYKLNKLNPTSPKVETWMNEAIAIKITDYVKNGGAWFAWHSGIASYQEVEAYTFMVHGYFDYHPDLQKVKYVAERGNRIIHQETVYEIVDEHYFVNVDQMKTNVFLRSQSIDGTSIAGWSHSYGRGRVICLTPAHLKEGLFHPTTIEIINKSIKWCLLKEE